MIKSRSTWFQSNSAFRFFSAAFAFVICIASVLLLSNTGFCAQVTLAWDPASGVAGYKVHYGTASRSYPLVVDTGSQSTATITGLTAGQTYYFAATAYNASGTESTYSNEVSYLVPSSCSYAVSPTSASFTSSASTGSVTVTTSATCSWSTTNTASWVSITSGATGAGSGTVKYSVSSNTGSGSRSAALTIAGITFSITQSGTSTSTNTTGTSTSTNTISATAGPGGSISPSGAVSVTSGGSQSFAITPSSGYVITAVTVDGASVGAVSSYTFSNVRANHTIAASFGGGGGGSGSDVWSSTMVPGVADSGPDSGVELGVKFRSDVAGYISGIRFYKASTNTGTHVGNIWTTGGALLATATFTNETASGWQQVNFSTPVAISANTVYVASYHTNSGHYSDDLYYFSGKGVDTPPLHLLADGVSGPNGVFAYGSTSSFPSQGWYSSNYWVDVVFSAAATANLTITTASLPAGAQNVAYSTTLAASGGTSPYTWSVTSGSLPAGLVLNGSTGAISGTPTASGTFNFAVGVTDSSSTRKTATMSFAITVAASQQQKTSYTIWPGTSVPGVADEGADSPVELGVKFRSDVNGYITGIRFYKASGNTGTHVGNLWSSTGALLATATFTSETVSGWQQVNFSTPVAVTANTVYVASYHVNGGHYSCDQNYFVGMGVDAAPLHALASGVSGNNGVYAYGSTSAFPNMSWYSSNYWVDVVFSR